jgi:hypothetical protein
MGLDRIERRTGRLQLDRSNQQLIIRHARDLCTGGLAALPREIGGVEHGYDNTLLRPSNQHE